MDCEYPLDQKQASYGSENWQEENRRITREEDSNGQFSGYVRRAEEILYGYYSYTGFGAARRL